MKSKIENTQRLLMSAIPSAPHDVQIISDKKPNSSTGMYVPFGKSNNFPDYLNDLYENSAIMSAIIRSITDYVAGDSIEFDTNIRLQLKGNTSASLKKLMKKVIFDKILTNGFALKLTYNKLGEVAEIKWLDIRNIRINYEQTIAYYSETFSQGRRGELEQYPLFDTFTIGEDGQYSCIYYDNGGSRGIYPVPTYEGALRSIETGIQVTKFHLMSIQNNMSSNCIINIPDGSNYSDEEKREIEMQFRNNFSGSENASGFMLSFVEDKEHAVTVERIQDDNQDRKYRELNKDVIKNIFTAFRCPPVLTGYLGESLGFAGQEFKESFMLFNVTVIAPLQKYIQSCFDEIFNNLNTIDIKPFKINFED